MLVAIVLAAGKGTRMRSEKPKALFEAAGKPMINYVIESAREAGAEKVVVVLGNGADEVKEHLKDADVRFCIQPELNGTAGAVKAAFDLIDNDDRVLILCGDMPLIRGETLKKFAEESRGEINFISVKTDNAKGYGRVVRSPRGTVLKIVEEKDANDHEKKINEVNSGVYLCGGAELKKRVAEVGSNNAQGEYYLTDIITSGTFVYRCENACEFSGVNDRAQLAAVSKKIWRERADKFMASGVTVMDPDAFYCDDDVTIGGDTVIYPGVFIEKGSRVGSGCVIYPGVRITSSIIEDGCEIKDQSVIEGAAVGAGSSVGPMARLRPGAVLKGNNKVGNFVEIKKSVLGTDTKASHLTYLGDAVIGSDVNLGCGTITCNYDGYNKYATVIGDGVFVGSDVQLIAPVKIGNGALIAAGSSVTEDVPEGALAVARARQKNIEGAGRAFMEKRKAGPR